MSGRPANRSRKQRAVQESDEEEAVQERQPKRRSSKKPANFVVDDDEEDSDHQLDSDAEIDDEDNDDDDADESEGENRSKRGKRRSAGGASAGGSKRSRGGARGASGSGRAPAAAAAAAAAEANEEGASFGISDGPIQVSLRDCQSAENKAVEYMNVAECDLLGLQTSGNAVTEQGFKMLVRQVVRHVIFAHSAAPGVPIPRSELTKLVSDNSNSKKQGLAAAVLTTAQAQLAGKFGLDLMEQGKGKSASTNGPKQFVLRSVLPRGLYAAVVEPPGTAAARGFLAAVMCLIQIAGGSMAEEELWRHLGDLGVVRGSEHPALGNPAALLEDFVKKRQLHMERVSGVDGIEKTYSIAENAEVKERDLERFRDAEMNRT